MVLFGHWSHHKIDAHVKRGKKKVRYLFWLVMSIYSCVDFVLFFSGDRGQREVPHPHLRRSALSQCGHVVALPQPRCGTAAAELRVHLKQIQHQHCRRK